MMNYPNPEPNSWIPSEDPPKPEANWVPKENLPKSPVDKTALWLILGVVAFLGLFIGGGFLWESHVSETLSLKSAKEACIKGEDHNVKLTDKGKTLLIEFKEDSYTLNSWGCFMLELKVPDYVQSQIEHTRAIDGEKVASWDGYTARWGFHPDTGLYFNITTLKG